MAAADNHGRGPASKDGRVEASDSLKLNVGEEAERAIGVTECLTWIADTIEEQLGSQQGKRPGP